MAATPTQQRHVVAASYLGWTLDAFDFFIMVFVLTDIAKVLDDQDPGEAAEGRAR